MFSSISTHENKLLVAEVLPADDTSSRSGFKCDDMIIALCSIIRDPNRYLINIQQPAGEEFSGTIKK